MISIILKKSRNLFITTFFSLFFQFFVSAQYEFKIYEKKDGFNSPENSFVFADSRHFVWSSGIDGITKFDGKRFVNYSKSYGLNDSQVNCMAEDKEGNLICGTRKGVSFFSGARFQNIPMKSGVKLKASSQFVKCLFVSDSNSIFAGTLNGLYRYNVKLKSFVLIESIASKIYSISSDKKGKIFVSSKNGLFLLNNFKSNVPLKLKVDKKVIITVLKQIKDNLFWAGTDNGFFKVELKNNSLVFKNQNKNDLINEILSIDREKFVFIRNTGFIDVLNKQQIKTFNLTETFNYLEIKSATIDYQGNIWLASTLGLIKMYISNIKKVNYFNNENHVTATIAKGNKETVFFGTIDGLIVKKGATFKKFTISNVQEDNFISGLAYKENLLYVGTLSGKAFVFKNGVFKQLYKSNKEIACVYRIIPINQNSRWIASFSDIVYQKNTEEKTYHISNQYTQDLLLDSKNRLWFANLSTIGYIKNQKIHSLNTKFKKYDNFVTLAHDKCGAMWIGTYGHGVLRYYKGKIKQYSLSNGLTNNFISSSFYDKKNNVIWVGTMYGISSLKLDMYSNVTDINNYLNGDNIESYGCVQNAICLLENGNMLFSVGEELFEIKTQNNNKHNFELKLQFNDVIVNRKPIVTADESESKVDSWTGLPLHSKLNSSANNIDFSFTAIDFNSPHALKYSWKLEGFDTKWVDYSEREFVSYTNLPSGEYTFKIKATNQSGDYAAIKQITFEISKPYFLEWWFILFVVVTFLLVLYVYFQNKIQKIKKIETEKAENYKQLAESELKYLRSQMNPHFMFNTLNAIQEIVLKGDSESSRIYFADFAKMMRMILSNSSEKFISLEREIEFLQLYLRFETIRFQEKFEVHFNVDAKLELYAIKIPGMLLQPLIENAINHGLFHKKERGILTIQFYEEIESENKYLICAITDNGIGIHNNVASSTENHQSKSTKISQERIAILNSLYGENKFTLTLINLADSSDESGTKVVVKIAIN